MNKLEKYFGPVFLVIPITWAGSFVAAKYVVYEIDAISSVIFRFLISALCLLPALAVFHRMRHPDFREKGFLWHLFIAVTAGGIGYHLFFFKGLEHTTPTNAALIIGLVFLKITISPKAVKKGFRAIIKAALVGVVCSNPLKKNR